MIDQCSNSLRKPGRGDRQVNGGVGLDNVSKRLKPTVPSSHELRIDKSEKQYDVYLEIKSADDNCYCHRWWTLAYSWLPLYSETPVWSCLAASIIHSMQLNLWPRKQSIWYCGYSDAWPVGDLNLPGHSVRDQSYFTTLHMIKYALDGFRLMCALPSKTLQLWRGSESSTKVQSL